MTFTPRTGFGPRTHVTVSVPRPDGAWTDSYTTGTYSTLRLQQLLAQLGYLPLSWAADLGGTVTPDDPAAQLAAAYSPPLGTFTWQRGYPAALTSFWRPGQGNLITTGAIMAFQSRHGMTPDGVARPAVWTALLHAEAAQQTNPAGYTYAIASKAMPETLTIWHDGRKVFGSLANTGIAVSPTASGTYPVYLRFYFQVMRGTNPDGSQYADPVYYVSYFNGGDAVHYFPRGGYGYPQSLGCVELPYDAAAKAWPYLTYGSLVTVTPA
jgi:peptidoglycan hydrolase-like protein with peptidoglycan-binding domain